MASGGCEGEEEGEGFRVRAGLPNLVDAVAQAEPERRQGRGKGGSFIWRRREEERKKRVERPAETEGAEPWEELLTAGWTFWGAEEDVEDDHAIR